MEHHHIFRFLVVRDLTIILLVGGLGVGDQKNYLCEVPILFSSTPFCEMWPKRESSDQSQEHSKNWKIKFEILRKENCRVCAFQVAEVWAKFLGLPQNLTLNGSVWALKWCNNCRNIAFHLGYKTFNNMYLRYNHSVYYALSLEVLQATTFDQFSYKSIE